MPVKGTCHASQLVYSQQFPALALFEIITFLRYVVANQLVASIRQNDSATAGGA